MIPPISAKSQRNFKPAQCPHGLGFSVPTVSVSVSPRSRFTAIGVPNGIGCVPFSFRRLICIANRRNLKEFRLRVITVLAGLSIDGGRPR